MTSLRYTSAHHFGHLGVLALCFGAIACGRSHGNAPDAGSDVGVDAGFIDAGFIDAGFIDAGFIDDAGIPSCEGQDAQEIVCPDVVCDGLPTWYWNGDSCEPVECGTCEGVDCGSGYRSAEECQAAHASCEATLCQGTGGEWMWWAEECGHRVCGEIQPQTCELGGPACNCGTTRRFEFGRGCVPDECPEIDPLPRDVLCMSTGGAWENICCDSVCGERCEAGCAALACDCPPLQVFDSVFGCVDSAECYERSLGETCEPQARCETGTICCMHCGGAGCFGANCQAPLCDEDDTIDVCGNNLLAP